MSQLVNFTNAYQERHCPYIFIERCLMDVSWLYACSRLTFVCALVCTCLPLASGQFPGTMSSSRYNHYMPSSFQEEFGLLRGCLQVNPICKGGTNFEISPDAIFASSRSSHNFGTSDMDYQGRQTSEHDTRWQD